ncbi:tellurite resistance/C4-dicarboxylate transporter family protein [Parafrigoribacterium mesophilum]
MRSSWLTDAVRHLPPGAFAFVMATGIVSSAYGLVGQRVISLALLVIAVLGLVLITAAMVWRVAAYRADVLRDAGEPARAFGFFTVVAAVNVVGVRLYTPEAPIPTVVLAVLSVPLWLLLTYGVPGTLILRDRDSPVSAEVNGSWFLWVVGTQSLATAAAALDEHANNAALADVAVALWGIGVMLYIMLATLVTLRLLTTRRDPHKLGPSYWIYMGATAITVLAGSRILALSPDLPVFTATAAFISGFTYILWAFGMWWIPLLIVFAVWRHGIRREPVRYESELWSIVFPLGMYSVASMHFGGVAELPILVGIGQVGTWIAGLAWLVVTVAMVASVRTVRVP